MQGESISLRRTLAIAQADDALQQSAIVRQ
jgi:hypothetical protein